ncbi:MAG TPA: hypothetical protein VEF34_13825 [Syntrophobacteraceae bacterium]|nr:hypothetical protein [Syntrophobacteraceae bacterium]
MHFCEHSVPVTIEDYMALPDVDGIITPAGMEAFVCGRPARIRAFGMWLCADHADEMERGAEVRALIAMHEEP